MPLRQLSVSELGAFQNVEFPFVDGLNVFIGPNGTGKTHVLKLLYSCTEALRLSHRGMPSEALRSKLAGVFRPDGGEVGRLVRRRQGLNAARVSLRGGETFVRRRRVKTALGRLTFQLHTRGDLKGSATWLGPLPRAVFLPSREVLAMYEGFIHAYRERELSFDETYFDLCVALNANPLRGTRVASAEAMISRLREALGGHVELRAGRFYVKFHGDRARMEAHLVAEGLRKIASLERLVLNGTLMKQGYLMWDEPEANLNPRLIPPIAALLTQLAHERVQVFLATHDYLLARRISMAAGAKRAPSTRFFSFFREKPSAPVQLEVADTFEALARNPLAEEFTRLYEDQASIAGDRT